MSLSRMFASEWEGSTGSFSFYFSCLLILVGFGFVSCFCSGSGEGGEFPMNLSLFLSNQTSNQSLLLFSSPQFLLKEPQDGLSIIIGCKLSGKLSYKAQSKFDIVVKGLDTRREDYLFLESLFKLVDFVLQEGIGFDILKAVLRNPMHKAIPQTEPWYFWLLFSVEYLGQPEEKLLIEDAMRVVIDIGFKLGVFEPESNQVLSFSLEIAVYSHKLHQFRNKLHRNCHLSPPIIRCHALAFISVQTQAEEYKLSFMFFFHLIPENLQALILVDKIQMSQGNYFAGPDKLRRKIWLWMNLCWG